MSIFNYFDSNLSLKARISKDKLRQLNTVFRTNSIKVESYSSSHNENEHFCPSFEKYFYNTYSQDTAIGNVDIIADRFKEFTLNKSAIKQFIFYHFIPKSKSFVRKNVSFREIASICNVSIPTAKANHNLLTEAGLVYSTPSKRGRIDILIDQEYRLYDKDDKDAKYLTMSIDMLEHILSFNSVNELRVEILKILNADAKSGMKSKKVLFSKENAIVQLPRYIQRSTTLAEKYLNAKHSLFNIKNNILDITNYKSKKDIDKSFKASLRDKIISKFDSLGYTYSEECADIINKINNLKNSNNYDELINNLYIKLLNNINYVVDDFSKLAIQYGPKHLFNSLDSFIEKHCYINEETNLINNNVKNPGAYLRHLIRENILNYGSL